MNTGLRAQELCWLKRDWGAADAGTRHTRNHMDVFVLPESVTKNKDARIVVLNDIAQSIVEELREQHPVSVFIWVS